MPKFIITDKGDKYLERLGESSLSAEGPLTEESKQMKEARDFIVLHIAQEDLLVSEDPINQSKTFRPVIRRLFEAGYIDYA